MTQAHPDQKPTKEEVSRIIDKTGYVTVDPLYLLNLLWRSKWEIFALIAVSALVGTFIVFSMEPIYRATSSILIEPETPNVVKIEEVQEREGTSASEVLFTELEILRSKRLTQLVINKLSLADHPEYKKIEGGGGFFETGRIFGIELPWLAELFSAMPSENDVQSKISEEQRILNKVRNQITVEPVTYSYVVKVHADTGDPELSASIANTLTELYIAQSFATRAEITSDASGWLTERLEDIKGKLTESEKALQEFYEQEELVNIGGAREILEAELVDNSRRLREANKTKSELESRYQKVVQANGDIQQLEGIASLQQGELVESTKKAYLSALEAVGSLESRYGPKHPTMIEAQARLKEARDTYHEQLKQAAEGIRSEYEIAQQTSRELAKAVKESEAQIKKLDRKQHKLELLEHELETNRELFDTFLLRYKETDIASQMDVGSLRIIDEAQVPTDSYLPNKKKWIAVSVAIGAVLGFLFTLLRSLLDNRIKTAEDIEQMGDVHVMSLLPMVKGMDNKAKDMVRMELDDPKSAFAESIRTLRTSLMLSDSVKRKKAILIASSVPEEGKTSIAVNLAIACSQVERVLLLDADLRRPSIATYLNLPRTDGDLLQILSGKKTLEDSVTTLPSSNLYVLPSYESPPMPSEIIGSAKFVQFLRHACELYDRVIIDSAPCQVVSDALILSRISDATIFLAKANSTNKRIVRKALDRLNRSGGNILGVVLNQVELKNRHQYGDYYYYDEYAGRYGGYSGKKAEA